jgi:hypothetical protein
MRRLAYSTPHGWHAAAGAVMARAARAGRVGGDEFAVLLSGTGPHDLPRVAERVRTAVVGLRVDVMSGTAGIAITGLSVSVGAANCPGGADVVRPPGRRRRGALCGETQWSQRRCLCDVPASSARLRPGSLDPMSPHEEMSETAPHRGVMLRPFPAESRSAHLSPLLSTETRSMNRGLRFCRTGQTR